MYTAKTFLFGFVVLVVSNYVSCQPPGLPQFFHLPNFPAFGGQGPNSGGAGFLAFPFNFPGLPQLPFHGHHGPRPNATTTESSASSGSSSGSAASNSTDDTSSSSNSTADSSASSDRRRRSAEEQAEETFQVPQDGAAAPSGGNSQQPQQNSQSDQHHDKFLDFHFHRGRRAASDH